MNVTQHDPKRTWCGTRCCVACAVCDRTCDGQAKQHSKTQYRSLLRVTYYRCICMAMCWSGLDVVLQQRRMLTDALCALLLASLSSPYFLSLDDSPLCLTVVPAECVRSHTERRGHSSMSVENKRK